MLKEISWAGYFSVVGLVLVIYYFLVILLFYGNDIRHVLTGKGKLFVQGKEGATDSSK